jgi:ABC-type maltose transport system permease subunit
MTATLYRRLQHQSPTAATPFVACSAATGLALTRLKFANRVSMLSQSLIATLAARQAVLCKFPTNLEPNS